MFKTIVTNLKGNESNTLTEKEVFNLIETENPYISCDYHLLKETNKFHNNETYDKYIIKTQEAISLHNKYITDNDVFLFLGDISESELHNPEDIKLLYIFCHMLKGKYKILIKGNNDCLNNAFYNKCGFDYIIDQNKQLVDNNMKLIFSHEPYPMIENKLGDDWINIHGHIHGSKTYYNIDYREHIDAYPWGINDNKILRLNDFIKNYRNGLYVGLKTIYKPFWN